MHSNRPPSSLHSDDDQPPLPLGKPRISSVTDSSSTTSSPRVSIRPDRRATPPLRRHLPDVPVLPPGPIHASDDDDDDDAASTYSHASVLNLDDLDDDHLLGIRLPRRPTLRLCRSKGNNRNQPRRAVVLAQNEYQPHNRLEPLFERCVHALCDAVDADALAATAAVASFRAFSQLFTSIERNVIAHLFRSASALLRREAPTPWRSPLNVQQPARLTPPPGMDESLVRAVVYGAHILPAAGPETILIRLAGVYHREQLRKRAAKDQRVLVPLSFSMTLTALLAALSRLECSPAFRRFRSRAATTRTGEPHAVIVVRVNYDGARLSFDISLHGEAPCTVLFRKPKLLASRKTADFDAIVGEIRGVLTEFANSVRSEVEC